MLVQALRPSHPGTPTPCQRPFTDSSQAAERLQIERRTEVNRLRQDFEDEREQYRKETEAKHKRELEQLRLKVGLYVMGGLVRITRISHI